jgi:ribonuclease HI
MILSFPEPGKILLKTSRAFNVRLDALNVDDEVKRSLPIWFHPAANQESNYLNNSESSKRLRAIHKVITIGDLMTMTAEESSRHSRRKNCACPACKHDRNLGCVKQFACRDEPIKLLDSLHPKWDPRNTIHQPNPDFTIEEQMESKLAFDDKKP